MLDAYDYDLDTGPGPLDVILQAPPWREFWGWRWVGLDCRPRYSPEYGPISPRTGRQVSYDIAWLEYEIGRAGGGLWDYDTERECAAIAQAEARQFRRSRVRFRMVRTRAMAKGKGIALPVGL